MSKISEKIHKSLLNYNNLFSGPFFIQTQSRFNFKRMHRYSSSSITTNVPAFRNRRLWL